MKRHLTYVLLAASVLILFAGILFDRDGRDAGLRNLGTLGLMLTLGSIAFNRLPKSTAAAYELGRHEGYKAGRLDGWEDGRRARLTVVNDRRREGDGSVA